MESGILTKYSASAGSGKTYRLTGFYLSRLFSSRNAYKRILAVTFTNKAAADMKRKILSQLFSIAAGEKSDMADELLKETGFSPEKLASDAGTLLNTILHDYSGFSVGTIDSFFQKILKAFTREIGLQQGYIIELDHSQILARAVDQTLADTDTDSELRRWVTEYSGNRIDEGKSWNLRDDILKLAGEIFKEKFRLIVDEERKKLRDRNFLNQYLSDLNSLRSSFKKNLISYSERCREILDRHKADNSMFFRGNSGGVGSFLKLMGEGPDGIYKPVNSTVLKVLDTPPVWTSKAGPAKELSDAFNDGFQDLFIEALRYYEANFISVNTAILIAENIYILGILINILENVHGITSSENRFLLSDAGELLWLLIRDDQTPFIYEKAGNTFENFMIDEFQDTSLLQWKNFRPLISNSMAEGHDNLVVGDVKQSIYRWRNSDWRILKDILVQDIGKGRLETMHLEMNWRSRKNIISFNNSLFSILPKQIDESDKNLTGTNLLGNLYSEVRQDCPVNRDGGFVRIEFLQDEEKNFSELSLSRLPEIIENLQDKGYRCSDIGILVRTNREGASVLDKFLNYRDQAGTEKRGKYNYNIVSGDSLLLSRSAAVNFIISLLSVLIDPDDNLNRAVMLRNWLASIGVDPMEGDLSDLETESQRLYPQGFEAFINRVRNMPLFEAVENIILFFELGENPANTAYLNSFQDHLLAFTATNSSDSSAFLEWWNTAGIEKSIVLSDKQDAIRVMTIHKSKGLEFRAVILPFVSWNLGHGSKAPVMWINPDNQPFSNVQMVPVRYKSAMQYSDFAGDYFLESYNALVDNLNLLYVAFTRSIDSLFVFCPADSKSGTISSSLSEALNKQSESDTDKDVLNLPVYFNRESKVFSLGEIPGDISDCARGEETDTSAGGYYVNNGISRIRFRVNGGNLFTGIDGEQAKKLNYGRLMHEIFESVHIPDDIFPAIEKMVNDGRIPLNERDEIERRISAAIKRPEVKEWFRPDLKVMNEAEILTADGTIRRPDRIIIDGKKVLIVDFKFGKEKKEYLSQVNNYRNLVLGMGYSTVEGWLWYVDNDMVIKV